MTGTPGDPDPFKTDAFIGKTKINDELFNSLEAEDVKEGKSTFQIHYKVKVGPTANPGDEHSELFICGGGPGGPTGDDFNVFMNVEVV